MAVIKSSSTLPTTMVGWRRIYRRVPLSRAGAGAGRVRSLWMMAMDAPLVPDARVEQRIAQIDQQVDQHIGGRENEDDALDDRVVAAQDGVDREPPEAGDSKHRLGDDDAADQQRNPDPDDCHDRHRGVLEGMADQHLFAREAL